MQYLLVGNYGVGNVGDEALKEYFLWKYPQVEWKVLSANPQKDELPRFPAGIRSFMSFRWIKTLSSLSRSEGIVFGGGSLFTDVESVRAPILWWIHALVAKIFGKRIILAFQGIGPLNSRIGTWCARSVLRSADSISVRDPASKSRCESLVKNKNIVQSFDPVISLIKAIKVPENTKNVFTIIPRFSSPESFKKTAVDLLNERDVEEVHILSMHPDDEREQAFCEELRSSLRRPAHLMNIKTLDALLHEVQQASFVYTQRYHGALAALALGRDFAVLSQKDGDKLSEIFALKDSLHQCQEWLEAGERTLLRSIEK